MSLCPSPATLPASSVTRFHGFTLVEMLVVMAIIVVMIAAIKPALNSMKGANDIDHAAADVASMFQICRAYALANNTYVYLGLGEFDASVPDTDPQKPASGTTGGRFAMLAIASRDGTRHYSPYASSSADVASGWIDGTIGYNNGTGFRAITKLQRYDNLHLFSYGFATTPPPSGPPIPASGGMARPNVPEEYYLLGDPASDSATPITYPLGSAASQYTFKRVVQFDPEGLARVSPATVPSGEVFLAQGVPAFMEFGLIAAHGNVVPDTTRLFPSAASQNQGNHICLQVDGLKASVRAYRPGS